MVISFILYITLWSSGFVHFNWLCILNKYTIYRYFRLIRDVNFQGLHCKNNFRTELYKLKVVSSVKQLSESILFSIINNGHDQIQNTLGLYSHE